MTAQNVLDLVLPAALGVGAPFLFVAVMLAAKRWAEPLSRRHPLSAPLLRQAGHGLREQRAQTMSEALVTMIVLAPFPLLVFVIVSRSTLSVDPLSNLLFGTLMGGFMMALLARVIRLLIRLRRLRLGWEAEVATAQELDRLVAQGWRIFHDVPGDGPFNVDHVAVGTSGVFAVETKGRAKQIGKDQHRVEVDGDRLVFPNGVDTAMVAQARRQARWLSDWLSKLAAQPIDVEPVLCIPGWWIERKTKPTILVTNSANVAGAIQKARTRSLDTATVARVCALLDARCRDVTLAAYDEIRKKNELGPTA